jgi:hypothetical protein
METKRFFFIVEVFTNLRRCYFQSENLVKLIFASKNWLNDERMECKTPNKLVELIDFETNF